MRERVHGNSEFSECKWSVWAVVVHRGQIMDAE